MSNVYEIAYRVSQLAPGDAIAFDARELAEACPSMPLIGLGGPMWAPAEHVMENICGSVYEWRFWRDVEKDRIIFERLKEPLKDGRRTYLSLDRREGFEQDVMGYWRKKNMSMELPNVAGRRIATSNADLERAFLVCLKVEQEKGEFADNALTATLCEGVRLCREDTDNSQPLEADDLAMEIERLFSKALENECTCHVPESHCYFCSAWEKAQRETKQLIALKEETRLRAAWEAGFRLCCGDILRADEKGDLWQRTLAELNKK